MSLLTIAACLLATIPAPNGGVTMFRGAPGTAGDVVVVDPSGGLPTTPPELAGIKLEVLDFNGRTDLSSLASSSPRLREDVPGANRIELPAHRGSLYRYSRVVPGNPGLRHGLFVIDAIGAARSLFQMQGIGAGLDLVPFLTRIAIAPDGARMLVATEQAAGGDLFEIDLATGATINRTSSLAPQVFKPAGLHLAANWGIGATTTSLLRFDAASVANAQAVPFSGAAPTWFSGEVVLSSNGAHAATIAGTAFNSAHVFAFDLSGNAIRVSTLPGWLSGAGFLPEALHGPYLAISDDGSQCAWRSEGATREAFVARVPLAQPSVEQQVTADANYMDTLDEIGQFYFRVLTTQLVLAVGEASGTGVPVIENLDVYQVNLPTVGAAAIQNITQSNGLAQPPFDVPSTLKPEALLAAPTTSSLVFYNERSGGTGDLVSVNPTSGGVTVLVPEVKEVDFIERAGNDLVVSLRRAIGPKNRELYRISAPFSSASPALFSIDEINTVTQHTARADGLFAYVLHNATAESLWRTSVSVPTPKRFTNRPLFYGPTLAFAPSGELAFSVEFATGSDVFALWPTSGHVRRLPSSIGASFLLPGA